jgi:predicted TIM-barrel fold metal-dependent hydrolase
VRIDVHAHYFPGPYLDLIEGLGHGEVETSMGRRGAHATHAGDATVRIEAMDKAGVGMQILSIATGGPYIASEIGAIIGARAANDAYAEMVRLYPQRFKAFATLPLPHVGAALAEMERAFDQLGMVGIGVATKMGGKSLADPSFDPVYEELNRRGGVLFVHPIGHSCDSTLLESTGLTWPLGAPFEDTAAALQLLQTGFVQRFPKIRAIMPHLGGTLPFLVHRLDHQQDRFMHGHGKPSELVKKFWYDSVNGNVAALRCSCDTFGVDRIVFGTDYPFWNGAAHQHASEYIEQAGLSAADVLAISEGNAQALFGDALLP